MNTDFHVWKGYSTDRWTVYIAGTIGADASFDSALHGVSGKIMLNLRGITGINSTGIRQWISAIGKLGTRDVVEYADVSIPMIQQFNMILNARGKGEVVSFYAPYYCPQCDADKNVRILAGDHPTHLGWPSELTPPGVDCHVCRCPLEFNEIPERYFLFLQTQLTEEKKP